MRSKERRREKLEVRRLELWRREKRIEERR
jgi:hypothetical protein